MRCDTDSDLCCVHWHETIRKSVSSFLSEAPLPELLRGQRAAPCHKINAPFANCSRWRGVPSQEPRLHQLKPPSVSVHLSFLPFIFRHQNSERLPDHVTPPCHVISLRTGKWEGSYRCSCHQFELQFIFPVTLKSFIKEEVEEGRNDSCEKHRLTSKRKSKS